MCYLEFFHHSSCQAPLTIFFRWYFRMNFKFMILWSRFAILCEWTHVRIMGEEEKSWSNKNQWFPFRLLHKLKTRNGRMKSKEEKKKLKKFIDENDDDMLPSICIRNLWRSLSIFQCWRKELKNGLNSKRFSMSDLLIRVFCNSISFFLDALSF